MAQNITIVLNDVRFRGKGDIAAKLFLRGS
jgi:hypothetical protein